MAEPFDEHIYQALKDGLRRIPVPEPGREFDERILAGLRDYRPWWQILWYSGRPVISAAVCSMIVMLAILHFSLPSPSASVRHTQPVAPAPVIAPIEATQSAMPMAGLDKALDRPNLCFGTISGLFVPSLLGRHSPGSHPQPASKAPGRSAEPPKRQGAAPHRSGFYA